MSFHPEKCELLRVTNKRTPVKGVYKTSDHILKVVNHKKIPWSDTTIQAEME